MGKSGRPLRQHLDEAGLQKGVSFGKSEILDGREDGCERLAIPAKVAHTIAEDDVFEHPFQESGTLERSQTLIVYRDSSRLSLETRVSFYDDRPHALLPKQICKHQTDGSGTYNDDVRVDFATAASQGVFGNLHQGILC